MKLSLIIPVFNEKESLPELLREIEEVCAVYGYAKEVFFVDDGSTDGSWEVIQNLAGACADVRGIRFRRNFGKAAALQAGFERVTGDFVFTMDADLQDDPAEIPNFLAKMAEGYDLVSGWKKNRHDPWHKVGPSRVFNRMVNLLSGLTLHDHNCGLKCYRAAVLKEIRIYGEFHRFIPTLASARGFRVCEVVVQHRARQFGRSKYGMARFLKGFLDLLTVTLLTRFGQRPLHLLGGAALFSLLFGILCCVVLFWSNQLVLWLWNGSLGPHDFLAIMMVYGMSLLSWLGTVGNFFIQFSGMLFVGGLVGELVVSNSQSHGGANYSIQETISMER
ncbi:MAG: glycosyltransferase family 2 protein [Planctomycetia bacterium]|nr:glycosyltransferase family 2 protein [Planctomycetia bacterium]